MTMIASQFYFEDNEIKYPLHISLYFEDKKQILTIEASFTVAGMNGKSPVKKYKDIASKYDVKIGNESVSCNSMDKEASYGITVSKSWEFEYHQYAECHPYVSIQEYVERYIVAAKNILVELMLRSALLDKKSLENIVKRTKTQIEQVYDSIKSDEKSSDIISSIDFAKRELAEIELKMKGLPNNCQV